LMKCSSVHEWSSLASQATRLDWKSTALHRVGGNSICWTACSRSWSANGNASSWDETMSLGAGEGAISLHFPPENITTKMKHRSPNCRIPSRRIDPPTKFHTSDHL